MPSSSYSSSWATIVLLLLVPMITLCVPAAARDSMEHCLRMLFNPPPPPPPIVGSRPRFMDLSRIVCKDQFRLVGYHMRATGKLPVSYIEGLCAIFDDDEEKVKGFITRTFIAYDPDRLMDGRTCATIKRKHHVTPPLF